MSASAQNLAHERLNRERLVTIFKHKYHCTATFVTQSVSSEYIRGARRRHSPTEFQDDFGHFLFGLCIDLFLRPR